MQRIAEHSDCPVKTYSMTLVEVELA
ncbi:hypothetical protein NEAUS04_2741, partial [Nematocida ausubeli]